MKLTDWFKKLNRIVANYDEDLDARSARITATDRRLDSVEQRMVACTTVSADIAASIRDRSQIVLIGRYRNHDYVEIIDLGEREFVQIVEIVRDMRGHGRRGRIDAPVAIRHVFDRLL